MPDKKLLTPRSIKIQSGMAIASFSIGVILACICLFIIEPYGEIHTSAMGIVSELLCLAGALLGINVNFDLKMQKFKNEIDMMEQRYQSENNTESYAEENPDQ